VAADQGNVIRKLSRRGTLISPSGDLFATGKPLSERGPSAPKPLTEDAQVSPSSALWRLQINVRPRWAPTKPRVFPTRAPHGWAGPFAPRGEAAVDARRSHVPPLLWAAYTESSHKNEAPLLIFFIIWCKIHVTGWKRKKGMISQNRNDIFWRIIFCRERRNLQAFPQEKTKSWQRPNICRGSLVAGPEQNIGWPTSPNSAPSHPFQQLPLHSSAPELLLPADPGLVISFCGSAFDRNANPPICNSLLPSDFENLLQTSEGGE